MAGCLCQHSQGENSTQATIHHQQSHPVSLWLLRAKPISAKYICTNMQINNMDFSSSWA